MQTSHRIAFATYVTAPELTQDDQLAAAHLRKSGIEVSAHPWSEPCDWKSFDAVVIRSTWDYWLSYARFLSWLGELERLGVRVWNPPQLIRWNTNKLYLRELEKEGIAIAPTVWIEPQEKARPLQSILDETGWSEAVLKPAISAGSHLTTRVTRESAKDADASLDEILKASAAMIQAFQPEILSEGETSFLFYGGSFSHAVLKKGAPGEFRIQRTFGGTFAGIPADPAGVEAAKKALSAVPGDWLYARVDMIRAHGMWILMELEATEPCLFFSENAQAPERFRDALARRLSRAASN